MTVEKTLLISSYTDESGQDTHGETFVVCTVIIPTKMKDVVIKELTEVEYKSKKTNKWFKSSNVKRSKYIEKLLKSKILPFLRIYYSKYSNRADYIPLIGSSVAKAIINNAGDKKYKVKINLDKDTRKTCAKIKSEIKKFRIKYQKIRGISETTDPIIRLADLGCGLIRDLNNPKIPKCYHSLFYKFIEV
jgi:hypothetical protein